MATPLRRVEVERGFEASIGDAFSRVVDLSQRVAVDQLEVLRFEAEERLGAVVKRLALVSLGAACVAVSWLALLGFLIIAFADQFSLPVCLLAIAGAHALVGIVFFLVSARGGRRVKT